MTLRCRIFGHKWEKVAKGYRWCGRCKLLESKTEDGKAVAQVLIEDDDDWYQAKQNPREKKTDS